MKRNHRKPPAVSEDIQPGGQPLLEVLKLPVHGNAKGLEDTRCGMSRTAAPEPFLHNAGELRGGFNPGIGPGRADSFCKGPRMPLFTEFSENALQLRLCKPVHEIGSGGFLILRKTHIQRAVLLEAQPAAGIVQLVG